MVVLLREFASQEECSESALEILRHDVQNNGDVSAGPVYRQERLYCFRMLLKGPCECAICALQFRPQMHQGLNVYTYASVLSNSEAREKAASLVEQAHANLKYLREQCDANGHTIIKRWKKKSNEKRNVLLLEVDPSMYPYQWSDMRFLAEYGNRPDHLEALNSGLNTVEDPDNTEGHARRAFRDVCLLPYVNLESLKNDPAKLLSLLYNRVKYPPEKWASFDNWLLEKQWHMGSLPTPYNKNCIIMYGPSYGKLTPWQSGLAYAWDIIGFPRAILVLEAQMKLSSFLKSIVERLVQGSDEKNDTGAFRNALELGLKKPTDKSSCVEFASTFINQPFSSPPAFDIKSLLDIAESQINLHADHLWLLQTDPLSFRRYAALVVDGSHQDNLPIQQQYSLVATTLINDAFKSQIWEEIVQEIQKIHILAVRFRDSIYPGFPLPFTYALSLGCLEALLVNVIWRLAKHTQRLLPVRPGFRDNYVIRYSPPSERASFIPARKGTSHPIRRYTEDPLDFCLNTIASTLQIQPKDFRDMGSQHVYIEPSELFGMLDDIISKSEKKHDISRLDEILYRCYSDLSALYQMLRMVRLHQPRVPVFALEDAVKTEGGKAWRSCRAGWGQGGCGIVDETIATKLRKTSAHLVGEFLKTAKPAGAKASQKWLDQDQIQQEACSQLWAQMRNRQRQTLESLGIGEDDIKADLELLSADLAPEHLSEVQKERNQILTRIAENELRKATKVPSSGSGIQTQWGLIAEESSSATAPKVKVKTHSDSPVGQSLEDLTIASEDDEIPRIKVAVSKRTLQSLQALFPNPNFEERTKSVDWASFVHAMAEVGFAAKQTDGSVYSFEPTQACKWYGKSKILFHRPHPEPKYDAWRLLGMGKRMRKNFDWEADTFELAKKSG
ncbi:hypothetical protein LSUE1_G002243 [Lachnellula suecica]|uniref:Uncharacterized protein n=1 Tax=Lachnellula suecica TaxID=602035 RepID=A0A8T9C9B4_9HELO|nr:hypothetical protein LSUE1_G002243 [Lachnellula suecica]